MKFFATATTWSKPLPKGGFRIQTHLDFGNYRSAAAASVKAVEEGRKSFPGFDLMYTQNLEIVFMTKDDQ